MKKTILITIGVILIIALSAFGTSYLLSHHKVSFVLQNGTTSATIYQSDKKKAGQVTPNGHLLLKKGDYYAIPDGSNIATTPVNFTVMERDLTVTINPDYSEAYLNTLLVGETPAITAAITTKYPSILATYTLDQSTLYKRGDWYGGLLLPKVKDIREQEDFYRIVLHKENDKWQVIRRPEYILTASQFTSVPTDILSAINSLTK